jgi:E3 ubiquitin-protein ligase synoviolin
MDQRPYPGPPTLFHIRMNVLFAVLWIVDLLMFTLAVESIITNGMGGMVLFASEVSAARSAKVLITLIPSQSTRF